MPNSRISRRLQIGDPAYYRICVQGYLEDVWADRLAGMSITMNMKEGELPVSTLVGRVKDQAELVGVINGLYELRMPVLSVEIVDEHLHGNA